MNVDQRREIVGFAVLNWTQLSTKPKMCYRFSLVFVFGLVPKKFLVPDLCKSVVPVLLLLVNCALC